MKIKDFKVEMWMNDWENKCQYNLAETCIDSLSIEELLILCKKDPDTFLKDLKSLRLTYGDIEGSPKLLQGIASLYQDIKPNEVVPTHGAIGANHQVILALIEPTDNMVSVMPTYQQHYSIPESIGAEVRPLQLSVENDFLPDLAQLRLLVDQNTKMITINNPNNPAGSLIPDETMKEIVKIAESVGAYVLSDEVYRGIAEDGSYMTSIVDLYDKGISVGSMSKTLSLAGLRLGWLVSKDQEVIQKCLRRRDYDTISLGRIDDLFASIALEHKEAIFARNRKIMLKNRQILDDFVNSCPDVYYVRPKAGTTALVYYKQDLTSTELCKQLLQEKGVLFTPGDCFEMGKSVRIGYCFDADLLKVGLDKFAEFLKEHRS